MRVEIYVASGWVMGVSSSGVYGLGLGATARGRLIGIERRVIEVGWPTVKFSR